MTHFSERFAGVPTNLVQKVNGATTEETFIYIGRCIADQISTDIPKLAEVGRVLDFGCGIGRVIARLLDRAPQAEFVGFDIDPQMLKWCDHLLACSRLRLVSSTLDLADSSFDLITAISVFTHLDVTADFWLTEIRRLLRPGGRAFVTFLDDTLFKEIAGRTAGGYEVVGKGGPEGGAGMGTYYKVAAWEARVRPWFKIMRTAPRGMFGHQSYSVLQRRRLVRGAEPFLRQYAANVEKELFELRKDHAVVY